MTDSDPRLDDLLSAHLDGETTADEAARIERNTLAAYRWQYIGSGAQEPRFSKLLGSMITPAQGERIGAALAPLLN